MSTEEPTMYSQDGGGIIPLRPSDLVFNKTPDGISSCGYSVKNAILNSTLNVQSQIGGGGKGSKTKDISDNGTKVNNIKIMEDLVVPSSLYYCRPIFKHKVFNCRKGECDSGNNKAKKSKDRSKNASDEGEGNDYEEDYYDNNVIDESLYDKLLSLVSPNKRMYYDNKTRKNVGKMIDGKQGRSKTRKGKEDVMGETGEITKMPKNNNVTKNAVTNNKNKRTRKRNIKINAN
jgi:hypothetical protein